MSIEDEFIAVLAGLSELTGRRGSMDQFIGPGGIPSSERLGPTGSGRAETAELRAGIVGVLDAELEPVSLDAKGVMRSSASLLLGMEVVRLGDQVPDGHLIEAVAIPWIQLVKALRESSDDLFGLEWRRMEELIAAAYIESGYEQVILTPRSGDMGRDVIAHFRKGTIAIRVLDQVKRYKRGVSVPANDVRAMIHVLDRDRAASKAFVTTTSDFAPGVYKEFAEYMPTRLELRNGARLMEWFAELAKKQA